jgi:hypothetical protein
MRALAILSPQRNPDFLASGMRSRVMRRIRNRKSAVSRGGWVLFGRLIVWATRNNRA